MTRLRPGILKDPVHLLSTGFGLGLAPVAPGTFGTLLGVALDPVLRLMSFTGRACVVAALFLVGVWICEVSARRLGVHDHPGIVWDEVVGYLVVMLAAPPGWQWALAGFLIFRFFDIVKPWPIRDVDHALGGGLGIMLDDLLAAGYGVLVVLAWRLFVA
ncbi:MAG: phosphatidylglycerophosphatase A [Gammaproteobacteria bacterium]